VSKRANAVTVVGEGQNHWQRTANVVTVRDQIAYTDPFTRGDVHCSWDLDGTAFVANSGTTTTKLSAWFTKGA